MESTTHKSSHFANIVLYEAGKYELNTITYFDENHDKQVVREKIKRLDKQSDGTIFLELENGQKIDFDLIYSVDDEVSPKFDDGYFKCDCV